MFQSPGSIAFELGPISVHWYGIIIGLGILVCYFYVISEIKKRKMHREHVDNMAFWLIIAGVIGARLYYVLFNFEYYFSHSVEILQIWKGGLAIHGALIGGALAFFAYIYKHKLSWTLYADMIVPGMLLAQAVGRWGNFFNNEAFGRPTDLPWKLFIPEANRPENYLDYSYFHPTFLYESLWNLIGFLLLFLLNRKFRNKGESANGLVFFMYLIWYSIGRFFIEGLRLDSLYFGMFRIAQIMSVLLLITGLIGLIYINKKHKINDTKTV